MPAYLNSIACAVPPHERQSEFLGSLRHWAGHPEIVEKLHKIAAAAEIESRYTVLDQPFGQNGFYQLPAFPSTGQRMDMYEREAPKLAMAAVDRLRNQAGTLSTVTHLIVTSCTGFYAPGLDIDIVREAGLSPRVQRTMIGFMGCHAGLIGLRSAKQIVKADPDAVVLMVNVELCSLHLQQTARMDRLVSFLLFADGAAASLISSQPHGLQIDRCESHLSLADAERMAWHVEDQGFAMTLDARLPARIRQWFQSEPAFTDNAPAVWAVHPGGRLILDAVQDACSLSDEQMETSRSVLRRYGNMSSASIMFILQETLASLHGSAPQPVRAIAFGPGLTVETVDFTFAG